MIRVWTDARNAGVLDRMPPRGSTFAYDAAASPERAVSLTMPVRVQSWDARHGLLPIFDMNLPEGALRERLTRRFAKATGGFDDFDLLGLVGRSQIGRIRYSGPNETLSEDVPFQSIDEILRARRDGGLFDYLLEQFSPHSGISGVQPKVMIRAVGGKPSDRLGRQSPSILSATHIVKMWDPEEFPELAANEYFCLLAARKAGLDVPAFEMSDDGGALIIERFDLRDGVYRGVEDFCVLNAFPSTEKYKGGYERRLFRRLTDYIGPGEARQALEALFRLFAMNCAIRNGDAHLKNFSLVYDAVEGPASLAPVYDLVTTWAYIPGDPMALTLDGSTNWPDRRKLTELGRVRADLGPSRIAEILEQTADALSDVAGEMRRYFGARDPDLGQRIAEAWSAGVRESLGALRGLVRASKAATKTSGRRAPSALDAQLLALLRDHGGRLDETQTSIGQRLGVHPSSVSRAIKRLVERGDLARGAHGLRLVSSEI